MKKFALLFIAFATALALNMKANAAVSEPEPAPVPVAACELNFATGLDPLNDETPDLLQQSFVRVTQNSSS